MAFTQASGDATYLKEKAVDKWSQKEMLELRNLWKKWKF